MLASAAAAASPVSIFDGKTLNGWKQCNGTANYKVEGGVIVGTTAAGSPNSFLCSEKEYGDFVLEFETKVDPKLNSGVQFRSHRYESDNVTRVLGDDGKVRENKQKAGRVYGYQVEISNQETGTSGGIYDEARRGYWLYDASKNTACKTAFKDNEWNRYKVEATGDRVRTWVNDVPCTDMIDTSDLSGFIGLQVHSYEGSAPTQVRWRNIRITDMGRHEWKPIMDGTTMNGWTAVGGGEWSVDGGAFHGRSLPDDPRIGYLRTNDTWKDVTARVRYRIPKGNSGFFLRMDPEIKSGYEVEIDSQKRSGGYWEVGGRNWVTGREDNLMQFPSDQWNEITASIHGQRVVFHINGHKMIDIADDAPGKKDGGHIAIQAHGAKNPTEVWFKDIAVLVKAK